jgi:diacylglycerol kinase (ATP)
MVNKMWLVAINPHSGNGKGISVGKRVTSFLESQGATYQSVAASSAADLQRELSDLLDRNTFSGVIAVGGDGLVHLVLQVCVPRGVPFAVVPAGTGNDFVRTLGWSLEHPERILSRVLTTPPAPIDLGNVDSEWFGAILSTGFDSVVNEKANQLPWPKGPSRYNVAIAMELPRFTPIEYEITCDASVITTKAMLVAVGNGKSYGGGMLVCPQAQLHDGLFDVMILKPVSKIEFLKVFPKVYSGSHINHPAVTMMRAKKVSISANAVAYADGERIGPAPISAECVSGAGLTWIL